jgi:hypothetical protein
LALTTSRSSGGIRVRTCPEPGAASVSIESVLKFHVLPLEGVGVVGSFIHVGLILILRRPGMIFLGLQLVDRQAGAGDDATQPDPPFQGDVCVGFGEGGEDRQILQQTRGQHLRQPREQPRRT